MKVTTGRGIQFFKHPVFTVPKNFAVKTFADSKKHLANAFEGLSKMPSWFAKKEKK